MLDNSRWFQFEAGPDGGSIDPGDIRPFEHYIREKLAVANALSLEIDGGRSGAWDSIGGEPGVQSF
jgi:hypothetical protein